jgi:hypothetical protein
MFAAAVHASPAVALIPLATEDVACEPRLEPALDTASLAWLMLCVAAGAIVDKPCVAAVAF